ncbi:MAG: caspase family protein [Bacteroidota bacterium]
MRFIIFIFCALPLYSISQEAELVTQQRIKGTITNFVFSPDGEYLANISEDDPAIHVWHLASEKIIGSLQDYEQPTEALAYNDDGDELLSLYEDHLMIRWNLDEWSVSDSMRLEEDPTWIAMSGDYMFAGFYNEIKVFDRSFDLQKTIEVSGKPRSSYSAKNHLYVGTSFGELIKVSLDDLSIAFQKKFNKTDFQDLDISTEKNRLLAFNDNGSVTEVSLDALTLTNNFKPLGGFNFGKKYGQVHAGNGLIAFISEKNQIDCYNMEGNLVMQLIDTVESEEIKVLEFSPDGSVLGSSSFKQKLFKGMESGENSIKLWDLSRQGLIAELKGSVNPVHQFSFHPQKNIVALLGGNRKISVWDVDFAEKMFEFQLREPEREQDIALMSEEDKEDVNNSSRKKGNSNVLNLNKLAEKAQESVVRRTVNRVRKEPVLVQFSAKGNYLMTKLEKDEIRIYRYDGEKLEYMHFAKHQQERINHFMTDPEEEHIICLGAGDKAVSIVDLETGELEKKLSTENKTAEREFLNNAISGSYNPTGENFAVCTGRGQIFIWDNNFNQIFKTEGNNLFRAGNNAFINYSEDGEKLYMKGFDGVRGYNISDFNVLGTNKLKMPGRPYELGTPQNFMVGFDETKGYIEDLSSQELVSFPVNRNMINAVDASLRNYVGLSLKNGEFRLYDVKTGDLRATFIGEGENTIIKTADNYYKVNKEGFDLVSFRIGRKAYPFEQFDAYYNRPDLVLNALKCPDEEYVALYKNAHERRLEKLEITDASSPDFSTLPQLKITNRSDIPFSQSEKKVAFNIQASSEKNPLEKLKITINNVPVEHHKLQGQSAEKSIDLELIKGTNKVNVYAVNTKGEESLAESITIHCSRNDKPDLYLVTVGTSDYADDRFDLSYAAKDAKDLTALYNDYNNGRFDKIHTYNITNAEVKKEKFQAVKEFLQATNRNDQVIFYIAGHGVLDENFAYYYGTHDMDFMAPQKRGLSYDKLEEVLSGIASAKKLLIMDTCHSGEVDEDEVTVVEDDEGEDDEGEDDEGEDDLAFNDVTFRAVGPKLREGSDTRASAGKMARLLFADIRKGTGATVISSAGGVEFAMEGDDWKNGLFTYSLLNGITNRTADLNDDGVIMVSELQNYLIDKVGKLSHGKQVPTTRVQNIRLDYPVW